MMTVKEFVGMCADRNMEIAIYGDNGKLIVNGNIMEVFTSDSEELLRSEVYCFYCSNKKLFLTLKHTKEA